LKGAENLHMHHTQAKWKTCSGLISMFVSFEAKPAKQQQAPNTMRRTEEDRSEQPKRHRDINGREQWNDAKTCKVRYLHCF